MRTKLEAYRMTARTKPFGVSHFALRYSQENLLCIDREANLVVVELKRTEDGGHMDLQAIRYAAMSRQQRSKLLWLRMASFCRTEVALKTRSSRF